MIREYTTKKKSKTNFSLKAIQYDGKNEKSIMMFVGDYFKYVPKEEFSNVLLMSNKILIAPFVITINIGSGAIIEDEQPSVGDYICKSINGEGFYIMGKDTFESILVEISK